MQIIITPRPPTQTETQKKEQTLQKLDEIGEAFAQLAGDFDGVYPDVENILGTVSGAKL